MLRYVCKAQPSGGDCMKKHSPTQKLQKILCFRETPWLLRSPRHALAVSNDCTEVSAD